MKNNLLYLRENMNLTQKDVAKELNITTSYYGMIETGVRKPSINLAYKISTFFGSSIEKIFFKS